MGGWHSFPGGAVERSDALIELRGAPQGLEDPAAVSPQPESLAGETLAPDLVPGLAAAALRELQEETGLELADAARLVFAGRWLTPPLGPLRFDNRFFLLEWPASEPRQPSGWSPEPRSSVPRPARCWPRRRSSTSCACWPRTGPSTGSSGCATPARPTSARSAPSSSAPGSCSSRCAPRPCPPPPTPTATWWGAAKRC